MGEFGDLFGGLGDMLGGIFGGGGVEAEGVMGLTEMFSPEGRNGGEGRRGLEYVSYERYLCGGPRPLHINDR